MGVTKSPADSRLFGAKSAEHRKAARKAELAGHTIMPPFWYFLGGAIRLGDLELRMATAQADSSMESLGEACEAGAEYVTSLGGMPKVRRAVKEQEDISKLVACAAPLSTSFMGNERLYVMLTMNSGGMIDLWRRDAGLKPMPHVKAHYLDLDSIGATLSERIQALRQAKSPDNRHFSKLSLWEMARAAIPINTGSELLPSPDDAGMKGLESFIVEFRVAGPLSFDVKNMRYAMFVTSPFSKGNVYIATPQQTTMKGVPVITYDSFEKVAWCDAVPWEGRRMILDIINEYDTAHPSRLPLATTSDPNAVSTLEIAFVPMGLEPQDVYGVLSGSRSLTYQKPAGFVPSRLVDPAWRVKALDRAYATLAPTIASVQKSMADAKARLQS